MWPLVQRALLLPYANGSLPGEVRLNYMAPIPRPHVSGAAGTVGYIHECFDTINKLH